MLRWGCIVEKTKQRSVSAGAYFPRVSPDVLTDLLLQLHHIPAELPHVHTLAATAGVHTRNQSRLNQQRGRTIGPIENNGTKRHQSIDFRNTAHHVFQTFRKISLERFRIRLQIALAQMRQMLGVRYVNNNSQTVYAAWRMPHDDNPIELADPISINVQIRNNRHQSDLEFHRSGTVLQTVSPRLDLIDQVRSFANPDGACHTNHENERCTNGHQQSAYRFHCQSPWDNIECTT